MLVPKLGDEVSTDGLAAQTSSLGEAVDVSSLFSARQDTAVGDPLFPPSDTLGEAVSVAEAFNLHIPKEEEAFGRLRSGLNAVARRTSQALFQDLPQGISILIHKTDQDSRNAQAIAAAQAKKRRELTGSTINLNPFDAPSAEELELTPEEREAALANVHQFSFSDLDSDPLYQFGRRMGDAAAEVFPSNPRFQGELLADIVPSAIGDIISILASRGAGRLAPGVVGTAQIAAPEFDRARQAGATEEQAFNHFLVALPLGAVEKIPMTQLLKRTDNVTGGGIKKWLGKTVRGGIEEGIQEAFENTYLNTSARLIYDEHQDIWEGLGESTKGGFGAGIILNGIAAGLGARRRGNRDPETGEVIDPQLEADLDTIASDIQSQVDVDPRILAEELVDWDAFQAESSRNIGNEFLQLPETSQNVPPSIEVGSEPFVFNGQFSTAVSRVYDTLSEPARNAISFYSNNYDTSLLDQAITQQLPIAAEIDRAYKPIRENLKRKHGNTIRLYRSHTAAVPLRGKNFLSFTADPKVAEEFFGQAPSGYKKNLLAVDIPIDSILYVAGGDVSVRQQEFVINATPDLKMKIAAVIGADPTAEFGTRANPDFINLQTSGETLGTYTNLTLQDDIKTNLDNLEFYGFSGQNLDDHSPEAIRDAVVDFIQEEDSEAIANGDYVIAERILEDLADLHPGILDGVYDLDQNLETEDASAPLGEVSFSSSIPDSFSGLAQDIINAFGIRKNLAIFTTTDLQFGDIPEGFDPEVFADLQRRGQKTGGGLHVSYDGVTALILNPDTLTAVGSNDIGMLEVLAHELGHYVDRHLRTVPEFRDGYTELRSKFREHRRQLWNMSVKEFFFNYRTPYAANLTYQNQMKIASANGVRSGEFANMTVREWMRTDWGGDMADYMLSFDEWFADQFSKWVATAPTKRDVSSKVGRYMQELARRLRSVYDLFFKKAAVNPQRSFEAWIEDVLTRTPEVAPVQDTPAERARVTEPPLQSNQGSPPPPPPSTPPAPAGPNQGPNRSFNFNPDDIRFGERTGANGITRPNIATRAWQQFIKWLYPRGRLDQRSFDTVQRAMSSGRAEVREALGRVRQVQDVIARDYPDGNIPPAAAQQMDQIMRGSRQDVISFVQGFWGDELSTRVISDDMLINLLQARRHIDRLSMTLISSGIVEGRLAMRIASNIGSYLHRSYRVHTEPDWAENVPDGVMQRARAFIRARYIDQNGVAPSLREMGNIIDTLLHNSEVQEKLLTNQRLNQAGLDVLMDRSQVPPEIRALWGEIESPVYNYFESIRKISQLIASNQAVSRIRDEGAGTYFFEEENMFHSPGYTQLIQAGVDDPLRPLSGWKTHPDILASLRQAFGQRDEPQSLLHQWMLKANGFIKLGKTVLNPLTISRNFWGGTMFMVANGHSPHQLATRGRQVMSDLLDKGVNPRKIRYTELGLLDQSLVQGETIDAIKDLGITFDERDFLGNLDPFRNRSLSRRIISGSLGRATQFYNGIDSMIRVTMFEAELNSQLNDLYPNGQVTQQQRIALEEQVAVQIRDTYQNYSQVPLAIRRLRSSVLVGPFVSFPYEAIRTAVNTMTYARNEMRSDNPRIRRRGYRRAFSLLSTVSLGSMATVASMAALGIDDETEDDITKLSAPWDRNIGKLYYSIGKGEVSYSNLGYTFPFTILERPLMTMFMRGDEGFFNAAGTAMMQFFGEFLGLEIGTQKVLEFYKNENSFGSQIYNPSASFGTKFADGFAHFSDAFVPGIIDLTVVRPIQEGADFDPVTEAWQIATGIKRVNLDVNKSFMFQSRDFDQKRRDIRRGANSVLFNPTASVQEKRAAVAEAERLYRQEWNRMQSLYDSAFRLGVDAQDLEASLESARLGKQIRKDLLQGSYTPLSFDNVP